MNPPSWLPKTAAHVTQRGFSEEPSLQRLLFAFPLSAAASHLDACQKRKEKKQPSLLLLNNLSIKTKPEQQPRAGRLFCLMLNIPRLGQQAPECQERVQGAGARCGQCGGCRAGEEGASSATSPKASLAGGAKISTAPPCTAILLSSAAHQELPFPPSTNVQTKQTKPN